MVPDSFLLPYPELVTSLENIWGWLQYHQGSEDNRKESGTVMNCEPKVLRDRRAKPINSIVFYQRKPAEK